jgi:hypothetical protein
MTLHRLLAAGAFCGSMTIFSTAFADGGAGSILRANHVLFQGQSIVSDSCNHHLDMQWDGNLVLYEGVGNQPSQARWSTDQQTTQCSSWPWNICEWNIGIPYPYPVYAILQSDGNFVQYDTVGAPSIEGYPNGVRWGASSWTNTVAELWVQNDGNMVVYPTAERGNAAFNAWASNTVGNSAPGPRNCPIHTQVTRIDQNTYYSGGNTGILEIECLVDAMTCGDKCTGASGGKCAGFTFVPDASSLGLTCSAALPGACVLLSGVGSQPVYEQGFVTGVIEHH